MKRFILDIALILLTAIGAMVVVVFFTPADRNAYLREYTHKLALIKEADAPRIIIIGGSESAFGIDSQLMTDSLHRNVINLGLHGGIGTKYTLPDFLQYVREGDVVVMMPHYLVDYVEGGNGDVGTLIDLMIATEWRNAKDLNLKQWCIVLEGTPCCAKRNAIRLVKSIKNKRFDTPSDSEGFVYAMSGFNERGDEASHWNQVEAGPVNVNGHNTGQRRDVNNEYLSWLSVIIDKYVAKGAQVLLSPVISTESQFQSTFPHNLELELSRHGLGFFCAPSLCVVDDVYCFDGGGAHLSRGGVIIVSNRLVEALHVAIKSEAVDF